MPEHSNHCRPAVFIDRDGTIIRQVELLHDPKLMCLLPGSTEAIRLFNVNELRVIVVTNQPVVARGLASLAEVDQMHDLLNQRLRRRNAHVDAFYFCPHHVNATMEEFRIACSCRKPNPGMMIQAAAEHRLDLQRSVMIGDTTQDIEAGRRAGVRTILVETGHGGKDPWQYGAVPDWTAKNLLEAAQKWLTVISQ